MCGRVTVKPVADFFFRFRSARSPSFSLSSSLFSQINPRADAEAASALKAAAEAAEAAVTQQGDAVRALKASAKTGDATKVRGFCFCFCFCFFFRPPIDGF